MSTADEEDKLVADLASVMRMKLGQNRHKRGWKYADISYLTRRVHDEARELSRAVQSGASPAEIAREAADVANMAAMVAARAEALDDEKRGAK